MTKHQQAHNDTLLQAYQLADTGVFARFDKLRGFLITRNGVPYQAMLRTPWTITLLNKGYCNQLYWLTGQPMSEEMSAFVYSGFADELTAEFLRFQNGYR
jgi:hypothetical protein